MTGFLRGRAVSQVDKLLIDGQEFGEKQIKEILKDVIAEPIKKAKKGKKNAN